MKKTLHVIDAGRLGYGQCLELQKALVSAKKAGDDRDFLILVEHEPVVTVGRTGAEEHLRLPREHLAQMGVEVFDAARGGDVTYHGPGQLVGYPIIDLKRAGLGVHEYLRLLEGALIDAVAAFGVEGRRRSGFTGVWTDNGKVAAIGIAVTRWISWHGFALNVARDIPGFDLIIPCGLAGEAVTSMELFLGRRVPLSDVSREVIIALSRLLGTRPSALDVAAAAAAAGKALS